MSRNRSTMPEDAGCAAAVGGAGGAVGWAEAGSALQSAATAIHGDILDRAEICVDSCTRPSYLNYELGIDFSTLAAVRKHGGVSLHDTIFFNEYLEDFMPGTVPKFDVSVTNVFVHDGDSGQSGI